MGFYIGDGTRQFVRSPEAPTSVWDGKWHHAAGTFDGSTVRLFIDTIWRYLKSLFSLSR
jgi:hypothetical protein